MTWNKPGLAVANLFLPNCPLIENEYSLSLVVVAGDHFAANVTEGSG